MSFTVTFSGLCDKPEIGFRIWKILSTQSSMILQAGLMGWESHKHKRKNFFSMFILCEGGMCMCMSDTEMFFSLCYMGTRIKCRLLLLVATGFTY